MCRTFPQDAPKPLHILPEPMYKPSATAPRQLTFSDFNQSCGMQLSADNEWVLLAGRIPWAAVEPAYAATFKSVRRGHPAVPLRMALGALIIQRRTGLSDRSLVKAIAENPYYQYFIGLQSFAQKCPFSYTAPVGFRRRIGAGTLMAANEAFLSTAEPTPEHRPAKGGKASAPQASEPSAADGTTAGTMILDATCSPSNIRFPQDFSLLNEAREKTDAMIDRLHRQLRAKGERHPRTYREALHKAYLAMAKAKRRPANKMRMLVRKLLCALERNLGFIDALLARGGQLGEPQRRQLATIRELHRQQKAMYDSGTRRTDHRIVSISQPHLRPVVRGKARAPVEFGAKYDVSVDEKGHARLERIDFEAYNECAVFRDAAERYRARTGHYPARALVDKIYRTKENREFCREHGIRMSGRGPGRPPKADRDAARQEARDETDRIEVERFFSREKRTCGAGLVVTRLKETTLASIALSVFVANLFGIPAGGFFVLYFLDLPETGRKCHLCEFSGASA